MTDFTTTSTTHTTRFTYRVRREVVVQHEWVTTLAFQCVDDLYVTASTQSTSYDRLSFTTSEDS